MGRKGSALAGIAARIVEVADLDRRDLMLFIGLATFAYGASLAWLPLGFIVPGAVLTAIAVFGVRK